MAKKAIATKIVKRAVLQKALRGRRNSKGKKRPNQLLAFFTVVVSDFNGILQDTTGWTATLSRGGIVRDRATFDEFGVARFFNTGTVTQFRNFLRVTDDAGNTVVAAKPVPADSEAIVVLV